MATDPTPIEKLQFIVAQYAKDTAILREIIIILIDTIQVNADMDDQKVREIVSLALLAVGENPADAD